MRDNDVELLTDILRQIFRNFAIHADLKNRIPENEDEFVRIVKNKLEKDWDFDDDYNWGTSVPFLGDYCRDCFFVNLSEVTSINIAPEKNVWQIGEEYFTSQQAFYSFLEEIDIVICDISSNDDVENLYIAKTDLETLDNKIKLLELYKLVNQAKILGEFNIKFSIFYDFYYQYLNEPQRHNLNYVSSGYCTEQLAKLGQPFLNVSFPTIKQHYEKHCKQKISIDVNENGTEKIPLATYVAMLDWAEELVQQCRPRHQTIFAKRNNEQDSGDLAAKRPRLR